MSEGKERVKGQLHAEGNAGRRQHRPKWGWQSERGAGSPRWRPEVVLGSRVTSFPAPIPQGFSAAAATKPLQSCPTLCDPIDGSPSGSPVPGILQARTLEWVAIAFSSAWKWKVKVKLLSRVRLLGTPWTAAYQAPPSMGLSRQKYRRGLPLPSPRF